MTDEHPRIHFADTAIPVEPGQSIGSALWAAGIRQFRVTRGAGRPRALYCGIGQCFDCLVRVDEGEAVRACVTQAVPGTVITPGHPR